MEGSGLEVWQMDSHPLLAVLRARHVYSMSSRLRLMNGSSPTVSLASGREGGSSGRAMCCVSLVHLCGEKNTKKTYSMGVPILMCVPILVCVPVLVCIPVLVHVPVLVCVPILMHIPVLVHIP